MDNDDNWTRDYTAFYGSMRWLRSRRCASIAAGFRLFRPIAEKPARLTGDAERLPFEDQAVHAAGINCSLQHGEARSAVLKEMAPITKKGDRIIACQPDWETFVLFNGELDDSRPIASLFQ